MAYKDSSGNVPKNKGAIGTAGGRSNQGANSPAAKPTFGKKQRSVNTTPSGSQAMANSNGKKGLNKNLAGDNENSRMENERQKTKYAGKGMQSKGGQNPKAKGRTSKAAKEKNFNSGTLF